MSLIPQVELYNRFARYTFLFMLVELYNRNFS